MKPVSFFVRFFVTCVVVAIACAISWQLWIYYMESPWTRDGRVQADVVSLAPDVSGPVVQVFIHDNESVSVGEKLFQIDPSRFQLALDLAQASLAQAKASMLNANENSARYASLSSNAASAITRNNAKTASVEAQAAYKVALANLSVAELNCNVQLFWQL